MRACLALALLAVASPALAAGVTFTFDTPAGQRVLQLDGDRMRSEEGARITIFDGRRMIDASVEERTYQILDPEAMKAMLAAMKAQMDAAMKNLPPEQRQQLEARPKAKVPQIAFERAKGTDTAAGVRCEWYRTVMDGSPGSNESCYASWSSLGLQKSDFKVFEKMDAFAKSMSAAAGMDASGATPLRDSFDRMPGVPVIEARVEEGERIVERKLVSVKRGAVADDRFRAPAGFKEVQMGGVHGPRHQRPGRPVAEPADDALPAEEPARDDPN